MVIIENITSNPWPIIIILILIIVSMVAYLIGFSIKLKIDSSKNNHSDVCRSSCTHIVKHDLIYISIIGVLVIIILLTQVLYNNTEFGEQLNFAGTISSIILSVLAIMMTINGENKQELTKGSLDKSTATISQASEKLGEYIKNIESINVKQIEKDMKHLQELMEEFKSKLEQHGTDLSAIKGTIQFQQQPQNNDVKLENKRLESQWATKQIKMKQGDDDE